MTYLASRFNIKNNKFTWFQHYFFYHIIGKLCQKQEKTWLINLFSSQYFPVHYSKIQYNQFDGYFLSVDFMLLSDRKNPLQMKPLPPILTGSKKRSWSQNLKSLAQKTKIWHNYVFSRRFGKYSFRTILSHSTKQFWKQIHTMSSSAYSLASFT